MLGYATHRYGVKPFGVVPFGARTNYNGANAFISEWETENADDTSSATKTIVLPLSANPVDIHVNWGDGSYSHITAYDQVDKSHEYATTGTKTIKIVGTLKGWAFSAAGDKIKLTFISQWGCFDLSASQIFHGCVELEVTASDAPTVSATYLYYCFNECRKMTNIGNAAGWDVSSAIIMRAFLRYCNVFNQDLSPLDISSVYNMVEMFLSSNALSTANYTSMLESWGAVGAHYVGAMAAHFGDATFTGTTLVTSAATATTADKLVDSGQDFTITGLNVQIGDAVWNTTTGAWALVEGVDNATTLSISVNIMSDTDGYKILQSAAAKAKAQWVIDGCVITDGGAAD